MPKPKSQRLRGMTTIEALLVAAAFIIVGVIGVMVFQGMGKSMSEALRTNAIVTADRGGFDVTVEVLNGKLKGLELRYGEVGDNVNLQQAQGQYCVTGQASDDRPDNLDLVSGQSATCRFSASLTPGKQYVYVIYARESTSGKAVQIAKGVVTVGIS